MLEELCDGNAAKIQEALKAAEDAIEKRIEFWDGGMNQLKVRHGASDSGSFEADPVLVPFQ